VSDLSCRSQYPITKVQESQNAASSSSSPYNSTSSLSHGQLKCTQEASASYTALTYEVIHAHENHLETRQRRIHKTVPGTRVTDDGLHALAPPYEHKTITEVSPMEYFEAFEPNIFPYRRYTTYYEPSGYSPHHRSVSILPKSEYDSTHRFVSPSQAIPVSLNTEAGSEDNFRFAQDSGVCLGFRHVTGYGLDSCSLSNDLTGIGAQFQAVASSEYVLI
jgi:hypothetical protein